MSNKKAMHAQNQVVVDMIKRGQQSTTNRNTHGPIVDQPRQAVCSATNRQKKTFNFGEIEEPSH
jgi:hypothetical protein